ncbi:hypothetical protein AFCA_004445 [Aspergillus flavus]|nr:hypothetical protein AFCA_004445 [Aspergillus flavus]
MVDINQPRDPMPYFNTVDYSYFCHDESHLSQGYEVNGNQLDNPTLAQPLPFHQPRLRFRKTRDSNFSVIIAHGRELMHLPLSPSLLAGNYRL